MRDNLGFPVDLDGAVVAGAAPKAKEGGGRRSVAATCSPRAYFLLEHLAATAGMLIVLCFYARSFLLAALNGIRLQDAELGLTRRAPARLVAGSAQVFRSQGALSPRLLHGRRALDWRLSFCSFSTRAGSRARFFVCRCARARLLASCGCSSGFTGWPRRSRTRRAGAALHAGELKRSVTSCGARLLARRGSFRRAVSADQRPWPLHSVSPGCARAHESCSMAGAP